MDNQRCNNHNLVITINDRDTPVQEINGKEVVLRQTNDEWFWFSIRVGNVKRMLQSCTGLNHHKKYSPVSVYAALYSHKHHIKLHSLNNNKKYSPVSLYTVTSATSRKIMVKVCLF